MVSRKCLATLRRPSAGAGLSAIAAAPRSGLQGARRRRLDLGEDRFSVAASRSSRLRARSAASDGIAADDQPLAREIG